MDYKAAIHKFSTKPAGYEAARQRENQRRHRARVKNHITDLEAKLDATQSKLDEALRRIEELTAVVQRLQPHTGTISQPSRQLGQIPSVSNTSESAPPADFSEKGSSCGSCKSVGTDHPSEGVLGLSNNVTLFVTPQDLSPTNHPEPSTTTAPVTNTTPLEYNARQQEVGDNSSDDCALLPPPNPGESTIRCRDAYWMLKDRVMPDFDPEIVTQWLKPGFRRAVRPGDGCRVETHILYAFVDHITSG